MRLQTDPTVIYGLVPSSTAACAGRISTPTTRGTPTPRRPAADADRDSRRGCVRAALKPREERLLYFVARGDGSSEFSRDLAAHNRAVDKYIRNGGGDEPDAAAPARNRHDRERTSAVPERSRARLRPLHHLRRHRRCRQEQPDRRRGGVAATRRSRRRPDARARRHGARRTPARAAAASRCTSRPRPC